MRVAFRCTAKWFNYVYIYIHTYIYVCTQTHTHVHIYTLFQITSWNSQCHCHHYPQRLPGNLRQLYIILIPKMNSGTGRKFLVIFLVYFFLFPLCSWPPPSAGILVSSLLSVALFYPKYGARWRMGSQLLSLVLKGSGSLFCFKISLLIFLAALGFCCCVRVFSNCGRQGLLSEKTMAPHSSLLPGKSHGQRSLVGCSPWGC